MVINNPEIQSLDSEVNISPLEGLQNDLPPIAFQTNKGVLNV